MAALLSEDEPTLGDALQVREVRTGCVGAGLPSHLVPSHLAGAQVPAGSPLLLGFHSGLRRNQATEAEITIRGRSACRRDDDACLAHQPRPRGLV